MKDFASILTSIRLGRGLSQAELAAATGLNPTAINHFEKGRRTPHIRNLVLLADALNTSADVLLGRRSGK
jgi:transcriptional regulator with XRE-family HTH domain